MNDEFLYSSPSDDEFQYEREDISWKKWRCQIDGSSADFLKYGDNQISDYLFESSHLLKKRGNAETRKFHIIESPLKHPTSETGCDFTHSSGDSLLRGKFDFRDIASQPDWAPCVTEDAKDNFSFLREESSSSSAVDHCESFPKLISVWGKTSYSPPNLRARPNIRTSNTLGITKNKFSVDDIFAEETWNKDCNDTRNGSDAVGSGKCTRTPVTSESKPPKLLSSSFQDKIGPSRSWLFEEGCNSVDKSSAFSSFGRTKGTEPTSLGSKLWNEDPLGDFPVPESFIDSKSPFDRSKHGESIQCSPFSSFTTENSAFCQPFDHRNSLNSPVYSKTSFRPTTWDSSPYSATEGTPPDLSYTTGPHGGSDLDLSGQGSVSEDGENKSELQKANCERLMLEREVCNSNCGSFSEDSKVVHTLIPNTRDCKSKEVREGTSALKGSLKATHSPEHNEETSSSVKIPDKSKNHADENGHNHDAEALLPQQNGSAEKKGAESDMKKILTKRASDGVAVSSSEPVMMLKGYVLQFLCLQNVLEETSALH
ncbi:hypothetical protein SLEP1_g25451 [Rubroshorea leprosula]|nr:hypothetical protein SLEP1_g25451 [Rubroshorea leprosula]